MSKQKQETKEGVQKFLQEKLEGVGNFFGGMDDAYMGAARKHVLQLPDQGSLSEDAPLRGVREVAGRVLFPGRYGGNANPQYRYTDGDASTKGIALCKQSSSCRWYYSSWCWTSSHSTSIDRWIRRVS